MLKILTAGMAIVAVAVVMAIALSGGGESHAQEPTDTATATASATATATATSTGTGSPTSSASPVTTPAVAPITGGAPGSDSNSYLLLALVLGGAAIAGGVVTGAYTLNRR